MSMKRLSGLGKTLAVVAGLSMPLAGCDNRTPAQKQAEAVKLQESKKIEGFEGASLESRRISHDLSVGVYEVFDYPEKGKITYLTDFANDESLDRVTVAPSNMSAVLEVRPWSYHRNGKDGIKVITDSDSEIDSYIPLFRKTVAKESNFVDQHRFDKKKYK